MQLDLNGKVAIVTGGAKGVGLACCLGLSTEGARAIAVDIDQEALRKIPDPIVGIVADVSVENECKRVVSEIIERFGKIDTLINNVGIEPKDSFRPIHESTLEMWNHILGVNLTSHFLMMKYVLPEMIRNGGGVIINIASVQAFQSETNGAAAYGASKGGLLPLTRIAALRYAQNKIRVLAVCPGAIDTPLIRAELDQDGIKKLGALHPIGRIGNSEEVASVVCFLASSKASFMTGTAVHVDGGLMAQGSWDRKAF
jgi:NAD(P)-dependent dehydrogenase (short-subunit alcohol dehydrogenase family)